MTQSDNPALTSIGDTDITIKDGIAGLRSSGEAGALAKYRTNAYERLVKLLGTRSNAPRWDDIGTLLRERDEIYAALRASMPERDGIARIIPQHIFMDQSFDECDPMEQKAFLRCADAILALANQPERGTAVTQEIESERQRQIISEGWTPEHDDTHEHSALASAALCYVYASIFDPGDFPQRYWPWDAKWWKPSTNRRNLVKAAALIVAEIERLDRAPPRADRGTP